MSNYQFDLEDIEMHWCHGCGNFSAMKVMKETLIELGKLRF